MWFNDEPFEGPEGIREWFMDNVSVLVEGWKAAREESLNTTEIEKENHKSNS